MTSTVSYLKLLPVRYSEIMELVAPMRVQIADFIVRVSRLEAEIASLKEATIKQRMAIECPRGRAAKQRRRCDGAE